MPLKNRRQWNSPHKNEIMRIHTTPFSHRSLVFGVNARSVPSFSPRYSRRAASSHHVPLHFLGALHAGAEEVEEGEFERGVGGKGMIPDAQMIAAKARGGGVGFELAEVIFPRGSGIDVEVAAGFRVEEERGFVELEVALGRVLQVEEQDFVPAGDEVAEVAFQRLDGRKEVADENHEAAFAHELDDALERRGEVGALAAGGFLQREHELAEMTAAMAGGKILADGFVEGEQADGVALLVEKVGDGGGESVGVLGLGPVERTVGHGAAAIDEQMTA